MKIKHVLAIFALFMSAYLIARSDEQPAYKITDPNVNENFINNNFSIDQLNLLKNFLIFTYDSSGNITELGWKGTTAGTTAQPGFVGEYFSTGSFASASVPATGVYADLVSTTLAAGDWVLTAMIDYRRNDAAYTGFFIGISTTSGNSVGGMTKGKDWFGTMFASNSESLGERSLCVPSYHVSISVPTTYYLKHAATYGSGNPFDNGQMTCQRIR